MAYLKKFNEAYAKLIAESVDNEVTVDLECASGNHNDLKKRAEKAGIEISFKKGYNPVTDIASVSGDKNAVKRFVKTNWLGGVDPKTFCEENDPDNDGGLWDLFDIPFENNDK